MFEVRKSESYECQVLSTETCKGCRLEGCRCTCHQTNKGGRSKGIKALRPHSYPRLDWAQGKAPGTNEAAKKIRD